MDRIIVPSKNGDETMEIKIPRVMSYKKFMLAEKCVLSDTGTYYIIDFYSFKNTNDIEKLIASNIKKSDMLLPPPATVHKFGIKLMKRK